MAVSDQVRGLEEQLDLAQQRARELEKEREQIAEELDRVRVRFADDVASLRGRFQEMNRLRRQRRTALQRAEEAETRYKALLEMLSLPFFFVPAGTLDEMAGG